MEADSQPVRGLALDPQGQAPSLFYKPISLIHLQDSKP